MGRTAYVITISSPRPAELFTLTRKRERALTTRMRRSNLVSIEPTRVTEARCITVTHPDRTYITDDFIVTHNSSLMISLVTEMLRTFRGRALVFSLEMTAEALLTRQLSGVSGIPLQRFRDGQYARSQIEPLGRALGELALLDIWWDEGPTQTVGSIRAKARRLAAGGELDLVVVDHIQLVDGPVAHGENRQSQMAAITRGLKALAKDLGVVVLALSQLNRSIEQRSEKRPLLSDLRESGTLEQDADSVLILWRQDEEERRFLADLRVAKARNGETGDLVLTWNPQTTAFGDFRDPRA